MAAIRTEQQTAIVQGQSIATLDKERRIAAALVPTMAAAKKVRFPDVTYWHLDCHAGSGWNDKYGVPGSPLVFRAVADAKLNGTRIAAVFCDRRPEAITELRQRLNGWRQCAIVECDNADAVSRLATTIRQAERNPHFAVGSILIDPNGYWWRAGTGPKKGEGPPIEQLLLFAQWFPRIDIILNLNLHWLQMAKGVNARDRIETRPERFPGLLEPIEVLRSLNRSHWIVAQAGGQSRHLLAIGRNMRINDHKALGLYDWESAIGQRILRCNEKLDWQGVLSWPD